MRYPNLNYIVEELSKEYSMSQIGQIFSESLTRRRLDKIAYFDTEDAQNNVKVKKVQAQVINKLKAELVVATFQPYVFLDIDFANTQIPNENSLLGTVKMVLEEHGQKAFEDIGKAVLTGSESYLKKVPIGRYMNASQFKEYTSIKAEIQKI